MSVADVFWYLRDFEFLASKTIMVMPMLLPEIKPVIKVK